MKKPRKEVHKYLVVYDTDECLDEFDIIEGNYEDIKKKLEYLEVIFEIHNPKIIGIVG